LQTTRRPRLSVQAHLLTDGPVKASAEKNRPVFAARRHCEDDDRSGPFGIIIFRNHLISSTLALL
jgi:hypothetical protein